MRRNIWSCIGSFSFGLLLLLGAALLSAALLGGPPSHAQSTDLSSYPGTGGTPIPNSSPVAHDNPMAPLCVNFQGSLTASDPAHAGILAFANPPSVCAAPKTCPGAFGTNPIHYDLYTVPNTTGGPACATISLDGSGCAGSQGVRAVAYLNSFDPANLCTNYLGDSGFDEIAGLRSFSVNVPAGATLVVEIEQYVSSSLYCASYSLGVDGLTPGCPTITPTGTPTITGTPTAIPCGTIYYGSIGTGDSQLFGLLQMTAPASTCAVPKSTPSVAGLGPYRYDTYSFPNTTGSATCATIIVDGSACGGPPGDLRAVAYLNNFQPTSLRANYLGDAGSYGIRDQRTFSVNVPAGATLIVEIAEYDSIGAGCPSYTLSVSGLTAGCPTAT